MGYAPAITGRQSPLAPDYPAAVPGLMAFVAGYVDVTTFLAFNGLFVAQATGSLVVAGAALETGPITFVKVAAIPVFFLAGIATTTLVRGFGPDKSRALAAALLGEALIIGGMVLAALLSRDITPAPLLGLAAMGVQSALARLLLTGYGSTNVMTSNITQFSIDLETAIAGYFRGTPAPEAWRSAERVGAILGSFALGVIAGGIGYRILGMNGLLLMVSTLCALAAWIAADGRRLNRLGKGGQNA